MLTGRKTHSVAISRQMAARIPYREAYEKTGIIKGMDGRFSKMYRIGEIRAENVATYNATTAEQATEDLLDALPGDVDFQFVIHNRLIPGAQMSSRFTIRPEAHPEVPDVYINAYNHVLLDNAGIGHNNTNKDVYYILSIKAGDEKMAERRFLRMEPIIREHFQALYGIEIASVSLMERLKVMYTMFHPLGDSFGQKIDLKGDGTIRLKNLKYMQMTTKDLVAPDKWNTSGKLIDCSILEEGTPAQMYVRAFYTSMIPRDVSPSFVSDITGISSQMIFSIQYEPMDTKTGFLAAGEEVARNTTIVKKKMRDTVAERKYHASRQVEEEKVLDEDAYFNKAALEVFKQAMARKSKSFVCTITIVLYAPDPEALDKDTELLHLSAAKFSSTIRTLDLQQCAGMQTSLPLCQRRIDCARVIERKRLAIMSPVGIQDAIRKNGMFHGINGINDSLILLNRRNNTSLSGMITGTDHPGKTFQLKRECFNSLLSGSDYLHILTPGREYDDFAAKLDGEIREFQFPDIGEMQEGYGVLSSDTAFKGLFMEALTATIGEGIRRDRTGDVFDGKKRLCVHRFYGTAELLMLLDVLWNLVLRDKHRGISHQIFIDAADNLFLQQEASEYFEGLLEKCSQFQTVVTFVLDGCVKLINQPASAVALEQIVRGLGYVKLLNLGPVERRKFSELLNLPNALLPYVSNVEPGKGIIVTPSSNIVFNDNYTELYPEGPFRELFARDIRQVGMQAVM